VSDGVDVKGAVVQGLVLGVVAAGVFLLVYQAILRTMWKEIDTATKGGVGDVTGGDGEGFGQQFGGSGSEGTEGAADED
jgi:hypothetical protein